MPALRSGDSAAAVLVMGFRFRRSFKIMPGVRLNVGKRGVSTSIGVRGARVTIGKDGTRHTVGIPGTGASWTDYKPHSAPGPQVSRWSSPGPLWFIAIVAAVIIVAALLR